MLSFGNAYAFEYLFTWLLWPIGLVERLIRLAFRERDYTDSILYIVGRKPDPPVSV